MSARGVGCRCPPVAASRSSLYQFFVPGECLPVTDPARYHLHFDLDTYPAVLFAEARAIIPPGFTDERDTASACINNAGEVCVSYRAGT